MTPGERHMANVIYEYNANQSSPVRHLLSIIELSSDGDVEITPFNSELPDTIYHDFPLHLFIQDSLLYEESHL